MSLPVFEKTILGPEQTAAKVSGLDHPVWVYKYKHPQHGWTLSIATQAEPGSGKYSLGGFRIQTERRAAREGYDNDREAIGLAQGMGEKVYWSRLIGVAGPLALPRLHKLIGGKCVLLPSEGARVGEPRDFELIEFATECLKDSESAGFHIITGQDMGHGTMSDDSTSSLQALHRGFPGSMLEDTSLPTGEGNFCMLEGMLNAIDIPLSRATVGLIGCGNVGMYVLRRLLDHGATVLAIEAHPGKRDAIAKLGVPVFEPHAKQQFLAMEMDALAVNAGGGSLDMTSIETVCSNERLRVVNGCENLAMPDPSGEQRLHAANKMYAPTEMCGMMGYLAAVEEYLCHQEKVDLKIDTLLAAASRLREVGEKAGRAFLSDSASKSFEQAVEEIYA